MASDLTQIVFVDTTAVDVGVIDDGSGPHYGVSFKLANGRHTPYFRMPESGIRALVKGCRLALTAPADVRSN